MELVKDHVQWWALVLVVLNVWLFSARETVISFYITWAQ